MCGRFTLRSPASILAEQFAIFDMAPIGPRFNIAPTQAVPVVRMNRREGEPRRELVALRWGLIPGWAKDPAIGNRMINARAETVAEKPAYRTAFRRRRCLVPADGFYEWQRIGGKKQPFFIHMRDDGPFALAGLWELWEAPDHSRIESFTVLTTEPNDVVRPIHNRMPVILNQSDYSLWLDPAVEDPGMLAPLLRPYRADSMESYPVSSHVSNPRHEDPSCIEPVG
jgi:putative SOS response-associated peptidase YedK